jgi:cell division initiation protein
MITPIEIRQHTFKKAFQGYNKDDVQNYLNTLSSEWERMVEDNKRIKLELEKTTSALDNLRQVESALHRTLLQAEETSKSTIENAKSTADLRIQEAEAKAKEMLKNAIEDRSRVEMQTNELVSRRNEILQQLKSYLTAQTERLRTFEEKEMKAPLADVPPVTPVAPVAEAPVNAEKEAVTAPPVVETKPQDEPAVVVASEKPNPAEAENQSFFEKSVVSTPVSTVINDIADEL